MSCGRAGNSCSDWWTSEKRIKMSICMKGRPHSLERTVKSIKSYFRNRPDLTPTEKARPNDFRWAAGFFEAEGTIGKLSNIIISQKNPWALKRLRALFGGSISLPRGNPAYQWHISGPRARGFIVSIYEELSSRRQKQVRDKLILKQRSVI